MKNKCPKHNYSSWLRSFFFLVIVCSSQVYSFHHLDHFHDVDLPETEKTFSPYEAAVEHSTNHDHDEDTQDSSDHQHAYTKHLDWHISRVQNPRGLTLDHQYPFASFNFTLTNNDNIAPVVDRYLLGIDTSYISTIYVRGPPFLA